MKKLLYSLLLITLVFYFIPVNCWAPAIGGSIIGPQFSTIGIPVVSAGTVTGNVGWFNEIYINGVTTNTAYWTTATNQTLLTGNKSGSFNLITTGTGRFGDGLTTGLSVGGAFSPAGAALQVINEDGTGLGGIGVYWADLTGTGGASFDINKCRNLVSAPTDVVDGDLMGTYNFLGYNSMHGGYNYGGGIEAYVDGVPTDIWIPMKFKFFAASNAGYNYIMEVKSNQVNIGFGNQFAVDLFGNLITTGNVSANSVSFNTVVASKLYAQDLIGTGGTITGTSSLYPVVKGIRTSTETNSIRSISAGQHRTTNDMINGFGAAFNFEIRDSAGVDNIIGLIGASRDGADNSGKLRFQTLNAGVQTDVMAIEKTGMVGIGTLTPDSKLHILGTNAQAGGITIESSGGTSADRMAIFASGNASTAFMKLQALGYTLFRDSAGNNEFYIDNNGSWGVKNGINIYPLSDSTTAIGISSFAAQTTKWVTFDTTNKMVGIGMTPIEALDITKSQNAVSSIKIYNATAGNVAAAGLTVASDTAAGGFRAYSGSHGVAQVADTVGLFADSTASGGLFLSTDANADILFYRAGFNEKLRITANGLNITGTIPAGFLITGSGVTAKTRFQHYVSGISYLAQNMYRNSDTGLWYLDDTNYAGMAMILSTSVYETERVSFLNLPTGGSVAPTTLLILHEDTGNMTLLNGMKFYPSANSTTAINIANAAGTTFVSFDTSNLAMLLATTSKLQYRDSAIYTWSSIDGWLNLVADTGVEVNAPILNAARGYFAGDVLIDTATDIGQEALGIQQDDQDQVFVNYQGTSAADLTKNITTLSTEHVTGHIAVEVNGTKKWIAYSDTPT